MNPSTLPKGQSAEVTEGKANLPGVYVHKETGEKFITAEGDAGVIQADVLMSPVYKGGWERVGDVPSRTELLAMRKAQEIKDAAAEAKAKKEEEAELKAAVDAELAKVEKEASTKEKKGK